jgi:hypothetical protein
MKKKIRWLVTITIVCGIAAIVTSTAQAHDAYKQPIPSYSERAEFRLNAYRVNHGQLYAFSAIMTNLMTIAISEADYRQSKLIGFGIQGVPFAVWATEFVGALDAGILKTYRCYGRPFTPRQAIKRMAAIPRLRRIMLAERYKFMNARAVYMHKHEGYLKGKGRCTVYYFAFAG